MLNVHKLQSTCNPRHENADSKLKTQVQNKLKAILGAFSAGLQEQSVVEIADKFTVE